MITSSLSPKTVWSQDADRQSREFPRLTVMLVVILALMNVSAAVLMAGSWVSITDGMFELERSIQDRPTKTLN